MNEVKRMIYALYNEFWRYKSLKACFPTDKQAAITENLSANSLKRICVVVFLFFCLPLQLFSMEDNLFWGDGSLDNIGNIKDKSKIYQFQYNTKKYASEKMSDEIDLIILSKKPKERDYPEILRRIRTLYEQYPESTDTYLKLDLLASFHSRGLISDEQFASVKPLLDKIDKADDAGRAIFEPMQEKFQNLIEKDKKKINDFNEIIKQCRDILNKPDITRRTKNYALLQLCLVCHETEKWGDLKKYIDVILTMEKKGCNFDSTYVAASWVVLFFLRFSRTNPIGSIL
jgi:hypothetical protein